MYLTASGQFDTIKVHVEPGDLKSGGWVRLDEAIKKAYGNVQNPAASLGSYKWSPTGKLARLNTEQLTTETMPPEGNTDTGKPVPGNPPVDDERFAIQFEAQERAGGTWQTLPGHPYSLNRIVVNNNGEFRKLGLVQFGQNKCQPITPNNVDLSNEVDKPCAYMVRLRSRRRLTTGRNADNWSGELLAFCARKGVE